jgi:uncharacterized protein
MASRSTELSAILGVCALLAVVNVAAHVGPRHTMLVLGPLTAVVLVVVGRLAGLSYPEMGLGRRALPRGLWFAAGAVALVAVVLLAAAALPATRPAFEDSRYQLSWPAALVTAFVVIPLGTVLPEEIAFRGVLWSLLVRARGTTVATAVSSGLFGLWHVIPSLRLNRVNPAVASVVGRGWAATALAVAGAVVFTALAGVVLCELRRRSGSLLAPMGLHWAVNGLGVLVTAALRGNG